MAIHSKSLGSVTLTGEDAKAFGRKLSHGRATQAAAESVAHGRKMAATYARTGSVSFKVVTTLDDGSAAPARKRVQTTEKR